MSTMSEWLDAVQAELGTDLDVDVARLLEVTKVVAHNVARPAAPLTAFLIGYAAGQARGDAESVAQASAHVTELVDRWDPGSDEATAVDS